MALSYANPKNGAVAPVFNSAGDFNSFDYTETQASESVIAYGAAVYDPFRGNGTPHASFAATGIAKYGAANTTVGFSGTTGGTVDYDGGTCTLTVDTGVTIALTSILTSARLSHARARAAVAMAWSFEGGGDATVTWPTS